MRTAYRIISAVFLLLVVANIYIFINRNKGYEYQPLCSYETVYPCCDSSNRELAKWHRYMDIYTPSEISEAAAFSAGEFGIQPADSSYTRVYKILKALYRLFADNRAIPDNSDFNYAGLVKRYQIQKERRYMAGEFDYASYLHFFSRSNGVLIRHVSTAGHINEHGFNEVFLPEERKWVYVDVNGGIAYIRDRRTGVKMNSGDIMRAVDNGELNQLEVNFLADGPGVHRNAADTIRQFLTYYFAGTNTLYYFYTVDFAEAYKPMMKLRHYLTKTSWYELYTHLPLSNRKFHIKQAVALAGMVVFVPWVFFFVYFWRKRRALAR